MERDLSYSAVIARRGEIVRASTGLDYRDFEISPISFNYEKLMNSLPYSLFDIQKIQTEVGVGNTPLIELKNITRLVRSVAPSGKGGRIFVKDERANPAGSFKDRRASVSCYQAAQLGYKGVVCSSSGNYGAAVASQAARRGIKAIIIQEVFDSRKLGQPEILEKTRLCEAFSAEVWQCTVGPELFYMLLRTLEETGFFSASLNIPASVKGIETLGYELAQQVKQREGKFPDMVVVTHAGGGNVTGTARGLQQAGSHQTQVVAASVDLKGLHMASDYDFNRKSFTTGHSGFGIPRLTRPDSNEVPRNANRAVRYLDRYVLTSQGEAFFATEILAKLEGLDRGPAGNTSLAAALSLAQELDKDQILVVQETEYTGAGKLPSSQLALAQDQGIEIRLGDPKANVPGRVIVIPENIGQVGIQEVDMDDIRRSHVKFVIKKAGDYRPIKLDVDFLAEELKTSSESIGKILQSLGVETVS